MTKNNQVATPRYVDQLQAHAVKAYLQAARRLEADAKKLRKKAAKAARAPRRQVPRDPAFRLAMSKTRVVDPWPFTLALQAAGSWPRDWAERQRNPRVGQERVRSWLKPKAHGGKRIPAFWADRIAKEFVDGRGRSLVPAIDSSWPCGVRR